MILKSKTSNPKIFLVVILILAFITRSGYPLYSTVPKGHLPYLYGNALINFLNGLPLSTKIPHEGVFGLAHLESIFFILFLVPFKLIFSDTKIVLNIVPGFVGIINALGLYMFVKTLKKDEYLAIFSAFLLVFNPFHAFTTKSTTPDGLALGLLLFLLYFLFNNKTIIAGILSGFILLTDYMIFGHLIVILIVFILTELNHENIKKVGTVLLLTFLIVLPWQAYLFSISNEPSIRQFGGVSPKNIVNSQTSSIGDTVYLIPWAITPVTAFLTVFGLYIWRDEKYFRFISASLFLFFIICFSGQIGVPPWRHLISISIFSSIASAIFLNFIKTKRILILFFIIIIIGSYLSYPLDYFVQVPRESQEAANWLGVNVPSESIIFSPSSVYPVLSEKPSIYDTELCNQSDIDFVITDENIKKFPLSYGMTGVINNITTYKCLETIYNSTNVRIFEII